MTVRSDVYALGLVLYELFTGKPAFSPLVRSRLPSTPTMHAEPTNLVARHIGLHDISTRRLRRQQRMKLGATAGLLAVMIACSCSQQARERALQIEDAPDEQLAPTSGLTIEAGPTRGLSHTDALGTEYGLVYVTTTFVNDSTTPIHLRVALPNEHDYPSAYGDHKFRLLLWPGLADPPVISVDSTGKLVASFAGHDPDAPNILDKSLEPGEEFIATIGTRFPRQAPCSAVAYELLAYGDRGKFPACDWPMVEDRSSDPHSALGLRVGFCTVGAQYESCAIIPGGRISFPGN